MELGSLWTQLATRQTLFWIATGALALGAAFLTAALVILVRRAGHAARRRRRLEPSISPAAAALGPSGEASLAATLKLAPPTAPMEQPSLALLLRRLQAAGDRLEEIAGDLEAAAREPEELVLKEGAADVEYVFRATGS